MPIIRRNYNLVRYIYNLSGRVRAILFAKKIAHIAKAASIKHVGASHLLKDLLGLHSTSTRSTKNNYRCIIRNDVQFDRLLQSLRRVDGAAVVDETAACKGRLGDLIFCSHVDEESIRVLSGSLQYVLLGGKAQT